MWIDIKEQQPKDNQLCLVMLKCFSKDKTKKYYPNALAIYRKSVSYEECPAWYYLKDNRLISDGKVVFWSGFKPNNHIWLNPVGTLPETAKLLTEVFQYAPVNKNWFRLVPFYFNKKRVKNDRY